jgi:hypothetical protein
MLLGNGMLNWQQFFSMPLIADVPLLYHGWYTLLAVHYIYLPDPQELLLQLLTTIIRDPLVRFSSLL